MTTKVRKWGNSLGVRLPKKVADRLALKEGSEVVLHENEQAIVIRRVSTPQNTTRRLDWKDFIVPSDRKKKENVSGRIDAVLYEESH